MLIIVFVDECDFDIAVSRKAASARQSCKPTAYDYDVLCIGSGIDINHAPSVWVLGPRGNCTFV